MNSNPYSKQFGKVYNLANTIQNTKSPAAISSPLGQFMQRTKPGFNKLQQENNVKLHTEGNVPYHALFAFHKAFNTMPQHLRDQFNRSGHVVKLLGHTKEHDAEAENHYDPLSKTIRVHIPHGDLNRVMDEVFTHTGKGLGKSLMHLKFQNKLPSAEDTKITPSRQYMNKTKLNSGQYSTPEDMSDMFSYYLRHLNQTGMPHDRAQIDFLKKFPSSRHRLIFSKLIS